MTLVPQKEQRTRETPAHSIGAAVLWIRRSSPRQASRVSSRSALRNTLARTMTDKGDRNAMNCHRTGNLSGVWQRSSFRCSRQKPPAISHRHHALLSPHAQQQPVLSTHAAVRKQHQPQLHWQQALASPVPPEHSSSSSRKGSTSPTEGPWLLPGLKHEEKNPIQAA